MKYNKKVGMGTLTPPDLSVAFSKVSAPDGHNLNLLTILDLVPVEDEVRTMNLMDNDDFPMIGLLLSAFQVPH